MRTLRLANTNRDRWYDILTGPLRMQSGTRASSENGGLTDETLEVYGVGNDPAMISAVREINATRERINRYFSDSMNNDPQWLEESAGEEDARRALLYGLRYDPINQRHAGQLLGRNNVRGVLSLQRSAVWENVDAARIETASLSTWGGVWRIYDIPGDLPARLWRAKFSHPTVDVYTIWAGIRDNRYGTSGFVPVWELEDGFPGLDTTVQSISGASPSGSTTDNYLKCNFATGSYMTTRAAIGLSTVAPSADDHPHFIGRYQVLLRCYVPSSPATEVAARITYQYGRHQVINPTVYISNTSWHLVEMGSIQIPPDGWGSGDDPDLLSTFSIAIDAELVSGTPSTSFLAMDALVLVPDERAMKVIGRNNNGTVEAITREDGEQLVRSYGGLASNYTVEPSFERWELPDGDSMLVLVGDSTSAHLLTDVLNLEMTYVPRWFNYRS